MIARKTIIMVGVYADRIVHAGIDAVIDQYLHSEIAERYRIVLVGNSTIGGPVRKLFAFVRGCFTLAVACAFGKAELVHIHTASHTSFYRKSVSFFIAKLFGKRTILHIHSGGFLKFYAGASPLVRRLIVQVLDRADAIIVLSEKFRTGVGSITKNRNLRVVYNMIHAEDYRQLNGRFPAAPHLLFAGTDWERKGLSDLLVAMKTVLEAIPGTKLTICGSGSIEAYERQCTDLAISGSVLFAGFLSGEAKREAFLNSSLFVLPSELEAMPMVIIEAMAASLPVVATTVGGIPEIVENGVNGILVPPHDSPALAAAIVRIATDASLYESMRIANARKVAEVFDVSRIVPKICGIYEEVMERKGGRMREEG